MKYLGIAWRALPILLLGSAATEPAAAALRKFTIREFSIVESETTSARLGSMIDRPALVFGRDQPAGVALIDESGAAPRLRKLLVVADGTTTTPVIFGNEEGFVWVSWREKGGSQSNAKGAGSTLSSIEWVSSGSWTNTGALFCNADPSFACAIVGASYLQTVSPDPTSAFYDIGSWSFHGTGFTSSPFVFVTYENLAGNVQLVVKGALDLDGTVPALPVVGVAVLGVSLIAAGIAAVHRR